MALFGSDEVHHIVPGVLQFCTSELAAAAEPEIKVVTSKKKKKQSITPEVKGAVRGPGREEALLFLCKLAQCSRVNETQVAPSVLGPLVGNLVLALESALAARDPVLIWAAAHLLARFQRGGQQRDSSRGHDQLAAALNLLQELSPTAFVDIAIGAVVAALAHFVPGPQLGRYSEQVVDLTKAHGGSSHVLRAFLW